MNKHEIEVQKVLGKDYNLFLLKQDKLPSNDMKGWRSLGNGCYVKNKAGSPDNIGVKNFATYTLV